MSKNSVSSLKKISVFVVGLTMVVSLSSCGRGKNKAEPSASASASVSASASASASPTASKKPTAVPKPTVKHKDPIPYKPLAKKPYIVKVTPTPEPTLDKKAKAFETALKKELGLDKKGWDEKYNSDPLTYKRFFMELLDYAQGALCSYMASGVDDFTLGTFISNEVSYDSTVQQAVIHATRKAYGCSGK
ncbi:MAG: hypothetical protein EBS36_02155 [Actinobacteria bacterium]|nr:hypothetical protein [Actinomycetota bacterium]NBY15311.1 hypothetical protein [Actinomycetota bacterium]